MSYYQQPRGSTQSPHSPKYFTYSKHPDMQETTRFQQLTISHNSPSPHPANFQQHGSSKQSQLSPNHIQSPASLSHLQQQQPESYYQQPPNHYQQPVNHYQYPQNHNHQSTNHFQEIPVHYQQPRHHYQQPTSTSHYQQPKTYPEPGPINHSPAPVSPFQHTAVSDQPLQTTPVLKSGQTYASLQRELLRKGTLFTDNDFPPNDSSLYLPGSGIRDRYSGNLIWKRPGVSHRQGIVAKIDIRYLSQRASTYCNKHSS